MGGGWWRRPRATYGQGSGSWGWLVVVGEQGRAAAAVGGGRIMVCDYCGVRCNVTWTHENEWIFEDVSCESEKNETLCFLRTPDQRAQESISNFKSKFLNT